MNHSDELERVLAAWFAADAPESEPEHLLGSVLARTARTRRSATWLSPERWFPMSAISMSSLGAGRAPWRLAGVLVLLILAALLTAVLLAGNPARRLPPPFGPAANGVVAYTADGNIFTADPTSGTARLVIAGGANRDPVWSQDGSALAFIRDESATTGRLYVASADGSDARPVTPEPLNGILSHSFSPDGTSVLFTHRVGARMAMSIADSNGVHSLDVGDMSVVKPTFRPPDGREILFIGNDEIANSGLYVINADGSGLRTLVDRRHEHHIANAAYSPDGARIAYLPWVNAPALTIRTHILGADGTGDRLVDPRQQGSWDAGVAWSNDGTRLAIVRGYAAPTGACVVCGTTHAGNEGARAVILAVDGSTPGVETDPSVALEERCCAAFAWSPDDSAILWAPTDVDSAFMQQVLVDPVTGAARPAPWAAASPPAWQRVAP